MKCVKNADGADNTKLGEKTSNPQSFSLIVHSVGEKG